MKKTGTFFLACVLAFLLSSCSLLPPKLWTDEEVLDRLYNYYGVEFEILTVEQEKSKNFFTDNLIAGKQYTLSVKNNSDMVVYATSEVTYSHGLYPGYDYVFYDNYLETVFDVNFSSFIENAGILYDSINDVVILSNENFENNIKIMAEYINSLGEEPPFNSTKAKDTAVIITFRYIENDVQIDIAVYPFLSETSYPHMEAEKILNKLRNEINATEEGLP